MSLLINKLSKIANDNLILDRINLYVPKGCLAALIGPSGSGKSSLLRVIAGLDTPTSGSIWLNGKDATNLPTQYRSMGFVFQNFALFKHMNVRDNISFALKLRKLSPQQIKSRVEFFLESIRITDIALQYPSQLSGGQRQRVALARSLAIQPRFLLLDEPFGALDGELRRHLSKWLKNYLNTNEITTIMVTHDQREAISMADEILVFKQGHLVQQGEPQSVYDKPVNRFVGTFLGSFIQAPPSVVDSQQNSAEKELNPFFVDPVWSYTIANRSVDKYQFFLRPHEFELQVENSPEASVAIITGVMYRRDLVQLELKIPAFIWTVKLQLGYTAFQALNIHRLNQTVYLRPRPKVLQRGYSILRQSVL